MTATTGSKKWFIRRLGKVYLNREHISSTLKVFCTCYCSIAHYISVTLGFLMLATGIVLTVFVYGKVKLSIEAPNGSSRAPPVVHDTPLLAFFAPVITATGLFVIISVVVLIIDKKEAILQAKKKLEEKERIRREEVKAAYNPFTAIMLNVKRNSLRPSISPPSSVDLTSGDHEPDNNISSSTIKPPISRNIDNPPSTSKNTNPPKVSIDSPKSIRSNQSQISVTHGTSPPSKTKNDRPKSPIKKMLDKVVPGLQKNKKPNTKIVPVSPVKPIYNNEQNKDKLK